ncbi:uncharacterized protein cubi_03501 [Cryptosporidium ubiquitum]|uniref:Uncharacterized protein n=1 Tax=Cryptosporidium ubiquitum TaxID=857276 RepID=A0A1J4MI58_9CRYT|nr:uncharacterized protein cubi_03501 [Cryptosporidium ubiquitum]OII73703.1 hypothetical protein cubi_03501 [Cryptosporidium ubiquitum]
MIGKTCSEDGSSSPMSLEDPDEPSPSPINPITLKHTLRLASRVSISNNANIEEKYFEVYPNSSLLTELGETLEAISVNDFSFSPSPLKLSKIPKNMKANFLKSTIKKNKRKKAKKSQKQRKNNNQVTKFDQKTKQENIREKLSNENIEESCEISDLDVRGIVVEVEPQSDNKILSSEMINNIQLIDEQKPDASEKISATPSFLIKKSFSYSKWIRKESIKNFINRYIPRFLIPAFKAIGNLRIRFATPTKKIETQQEIRSKKEKVRKKMKLKGK